MQTGLAFHLEFAKEIEKSESECGTRPFPRCGEPAYTHELGATESGGAGLLTKTVGNADGVNSCDVEEGEFSWDRWDVAAFANAMAKLVNDTKVRQGYIRKERPRPLL